MAMTTDTPPLLYLTATQVLQDETRMKRLKLAFCDGLLSSASKEEAQLIMDESSRICGGSPDVMSEVLQTRFFVDHTPFYWIIIGHHTPTGVPPLLEQLLEASPELTVDAQEDIMDGLRRQYDSDIYDAMKRKLVHIQTRPISSTSFLGEKAGRVTVRAETAKLMNGSQHSQVMSFNIPRFFDRLIVDGELWFHFFSLNAVFLLKAILVKGTTVPPRSQWYFELHEVEPPNSPPRYITSLQNRRWAVSSNLKVTNFAGPSPTIRFNRAVFYPSRKQFATLSPTGSDPDDPYWEICTLTGSGRDFSGTLEIALYPGPG